MNKNKISKYSELKFAGSSFRRVLKKVWIYLFCRPRNWSLGEGSYLLSPYYCNDPSRLDIGAHCTIGRNLKVQLLKSWFEQEFNPKITIGDNVYIGLSAELVAAYSINIGNDCTLSDNVYINDSSHDMTPDGDFLMDRPLVTKGGVFIGDGSFIGRNSMIFSGVQLGVNCVVGAGAVVTKSAPAYSMLAGNPARIIAEYNQNTNQWEKKK